MTICSVPECGRGPVRARGLCRQHYRRYMATGETGGPIRSKITTDWERWTTYVLPTGFCWYWTGSLSPGGYGQFGTTEGSHRAHRWAYEYLVGPIPDGMELDHLCRNRRCVNPDHLEPVRRVINSRRGLRSFTDEGFRTTCMSGLHDIALAGAVRRSTTTGRLECVECLRAKERRRIRA